MVQAQARQARFNSAVGRWEVLFNSVWQPWTRSLDQLQQMIAAGDVQQVPFEASQGTAPTQVSAPSPAPAASGFQASQPSGPPQLPQGTQNPVVLGNQTTAGMSAAGGSVAAMQPDFYQHVLQNLQAVGVSTNNVEIRPGGGVWQNGVFIGSAAPGGTVALASPPPGAGQAGGTNQANAGPGMSPQGAGTPPAVPQLDPGEIERRMKQTGTGGGAPPPGILPTPQGGAAGREPLDWFALQQSPNRVQAVQENLGAAVPPPPQGTNGTNGTNGTTAPVGVPQVQQNPWMDYLMGQGPAMAFAGGGMGMGAPPINAVVGEGPAGIPPGDDPTTNAELIIRDAGDGHQIVTYASGPTGLSMDEPAFMVPLMGQAEQEASSLFPLEGGIKGKMSGSTFMGSDGSQVPTVPSGAGIGAEAFAGGGYGPSESYGPQMPQDNRTAAPNPFSVPLPPSVQDPWAGVGNPGPIRNISQYAATPGMQRERYGQLLQATGLLLGGMDDLRDRLLLSAPGTSSATTFY